MRPSARHRALEFALVFAVGSLIGGCSLAVGQPGRSPDAPPGDSHPPLATVIPPGSLVNPGLPTLLPPSVLNRVPTRVRVPALGIDLPVVQPPPDPNHYPYCNVAEFLPEMSRPGRPGTTFIYAHARPGMFLPILEAARTDNGQSMIGMRIQVFTSDDRRFTYEVSEVTRHVLSLDSAFRATIEQLILQTSEGPHGTPGKTMLIALPVVEQAASADEAVPPAHPVSCS